jgi:hypothetical protein
LIFKIYYIFYFYSNFLEEGGRTVQERLAGVWNKGAWKIRASAVKNGGLEIPSDELSAGFLGREALWA